MLTVVKIIILLSYVSLLMELTIFHVPSVASSLNIWNPRKDILKYYSPEYTRIFEMASWKKIFLFILPLIIIYMTYFFPVLIFVNTSFDLGLFYEPTFLTLIIATMLLIFGRYLTFSSVLTIRRNNKQKEGSFTLHQDGMFSNSRNPGLVGLYIFLVGIWMVIPSVFFLAGIIFYMFYMHFKVKMEEDFLSNRYAEEYKDYVLNTSRYF